MFCRRLSLRILKNWAGVFHGEKGVPSEGAEKEKSSLSRYEWLMSINEWWEDGGKQEQGKGKQE